MVEKQIENVQQKEFNELSQVRINQQDQINHIGELTVMNRAQMLKIQSLSKEVIELRGERDKMREQLIMMQKQIDERGELTENKND